MRSITDNDLIKAEHFIKKGADVNGDAVSNNETYTPIKIASIGGNDSAIKLLLRYNANPNNTVGGIPLIFAAAKGHLNTVKLLLLGGADPNLKAKEGFTALYLGIVNENIDLVKVLLSNGANPNIGIENPLIRAVSIGNIDIVQLLLQSGADPYVNKDDIIIKAEYAQKNSREMTALIREAVNKPVKSLSSSDSYNNTDLERATWADEVDPDYQTYGFTCNGQFFSVIVGDSGYICALMPSTPCSLHKTTDRYTIESIAKEVCDCYNNL